MKKIAVILTALTIALQSTVYAGGTIGIKFDTDDLKVPEAPFYADNVVMLPLRAVMEKFGFKVFYNDETKEVHMINGSEYAFVKIGSTYANIDGNDTQLERRTITVNGTAMVTARFVSLVTKKYVGWSVDDNSVVLSATMTADNSGDSNALRIADNELFINPAFEKADINSSDFGWEKYGYANIKVVDDNPLYGKNCIKVVDRTKNYSGLSQDVKEILTKNGPGKYNVSAYIRCDEESPSVKKPYSLILRTKGSADTSTKYDKSTISISEQWTKISVEANLEWSGDLADALVYFEGGDKEDLQNYYIDMCSLTKVK